MTPDMLSQIVVALLVNLAASVIIFAFQARLAQLRASKISLLAVLLLAAAALIIVIPRLLPSIQLPGSPTSLVKTAVFTIVCQLFVILIGVSFLLLISLQIPGRANIPFHLSNVGPLAGFAATSSLALLVTADYVVFGVRPLLMPLVYAGSGFAISVLLVQRRSDGFPQSWRIAAGMFVGLSSLSFAQGCFYGYVGWIVELIRR
jgi:hypothetical protein